MDADVTRNATFRCRCLVLTPPLSRDPFNNVSAPGFQANFTMSRSQNSGFDSDHRYLTISAKQQDNQAASLTPLITYLPVLLPQQTVEIPFTVTYTGTNTPGHGQGICLGQALPAGYRRTSQDAI